MSRSLQKCTSELTRFLALVGLLWTSPTPGPARRSRCTLRSRKDGPRTSFGGAGPPRARATRGTTATPSPPARATSGSFGPDLSGTLIGKMQPSPSPMRTVTIDELVQMHQAIFLDAYGVLVDGAGALGGARELIARFARD